MGMLLFCTPRTAAAQTWQVRFNMSPEGFQAAFDELAPRGYVPHYTGATERNGRAVYQAVWRHEPAVTWREWHGIGSARLQQLFDELSPRGFVPTQIKGYAVNGQTYYAAIWRREQGVRWESRHGQSRDEFQANLESLRSSGFVPVALSVHDENGQTRFSGIWHQRSGVTWELRYDLTAQDYQRQFDRLTPRGYVPVDLSVYTVNGETRFAAIWERVSGVSWMARYHLTSDQVINLTSTQASAGYAPYVVAPYLQNGQLLFAGAWRYHPQPVLRPDVPATQNLHHVPAGTRSRRLPISPVLQQTQVWCWLAIGEMVFRHYGIPNVNPAGNFQCGIIGRISDPLSPCYTNCFSCIRPSGSNYGTLAMLSTYGRQAGSRTFRYSEARAISPEAVMANIDSGRPVIAGTSNNRRLADADAEHVVLIVGYELAGGRLSLIVNDPFPYPAGHNPFLRHGGVRQADYQYRIDYVAFRDRVFWHWSVFNIGFS